MATSTANHQADIVVGVALPLLNDLMAAASDEKFPKKITGPSVLAVLPEPYRSYLASYLAGTDDEVTLYSPYNLRVGAGSNQLLEASAWATASLAGGTKTCVLEVTPRYSISYEDPSNSTTVGKGTLLLGAARYDAR